MAKSAAEKIAMIVDGVQPHCDEPLQSAMICSHAGSMKGVLMSYVLPAGGGLTRTSDLPNPVLIAVGPTTVYAFKYKPKGFKIKLKSGSEVGRWSRSALDVQRGKSGRVSDFAMITDSDEVYTLEVTTALGGAEAYELFMTAIGARSPD